MPLDHGISKLLLTESLLQDEAYVNDILAVTPLRRIGELEELVGPAIMFASEAGKIHNRPNVIC